jgi:(E)-4-hydroxy-3-methylbut-2-enyl-diphosphate synthase
MGCIVNGPGEAKEADVGIAGSGKTGALFIKGQPPRKVEGDLAQILIAAVREAASWKEAEK